jgi:hypothetical protein
MTRRGRGEARGWQGAVCHRGRGKKRVWERQEGMTRGLRQGRGREGGVKEERGGEEEGGKVELGERGLGSRWVELMLDLEGGMRGWMTLGQPNIRGGLIDKEMALFQIFGYFHQIIFL